MSQPIIPSEGLDKTVLVDCDANINGMIAYIERLRGDLVLQRRKKKDRSITLDPSGRVKSFDGLGLSEGQLRSMECSMESALTPEDLEKILQRLRGFRIVAFQKKELAKGLPDPAKSADPKDFGLTKAQIKGLGSIFMAALHDPSIENDAIYLLEQDPVGLSVRFRAFLKKSTDVFRLTRVPRPRVSRECSAQEAVLRTECLQFIPDPGILENVPRDVSGCGGDKMIFFRMGSNASPEEVEARYAELGLRPVDLWELATYNGENPRFSVDYPNVTYWIVGGDWRFAAFYMQEDKDRCIAVKRPTLKEGFTEGWYFAGVRIAA